MFHSLSCLFRLLSRIKPNYQLSELVGSDSYVQWVELSARFTVESFINWRATSTTHFFLLALWSRLISSQPYLKGDKPSHLEAFVPEVAQAYIRSRLELAQTVVSDPDCVDDPLDNQEVLLNQLEAIPVCPTIIVPPLFVSLRVLLCFHVASNVV